MQKFSTIATHLLAAGMLLGNALAQQTPAATTPPASPAPATSPKAQTPAGTAHSATAAKKTAAAPLVLKTQKDKFSYALGMNTAKRMSEGLNKQSVPFDPAILVRGMKDGFAGGKTLLTDEQAQAALKVVQDELRAKQQTKMQETEDANKKVAEANKKEGEAFLAGNKAKDGVVTLASGLQYKILKEGTG